ncbi:MAG: EH signature domain-containing protein [Gammaproteobacteria bacterium]|nr:EH signature domain-containing protein [Gammaproteobacteria bacterium]
MLRRVQRKDWETATLASVTRAGRVAFEAEFRERRDLWELRDFYLREAEASTSQAFLGALMSIYLGSYEPGGRHTRDLASALDESRDRLGRRWSGLLQNVHFLFDPRNAAGRLGTEMCKMNDPYGGLTSLGFHDPHASGLLYHAHLAYVDGMGPVLRMESGVRRMLGWLSPTGGQARVTGVKEAIEALLGPWKSREPASGIRDHLIGGLVASYGDPRVRRGGVWPQVHSDCRDVLLRWLTGASIEFFLDVVSEVETSHMWQPRREFWWDLYERGRIDSAWVAFSQDAAQTAQSLGQGSEEPGDLAYGEQTAGGSRRYTSLLILKIGNCIVVEGSHNYKVHVFREGDRRAPRLFEKQYDCEHIRLAPGHRAQAHHVGWEERVRELIGYWS